MLRLGKFHTKKYAKLVYCVTIINTFFTSCLKKSNNDNNFSGGLRQYIFALDFSGKIQIYLFSSFVRVV